MKDMDWSAAILFLVGIFSFERERNAKIIPCCFSKALTTSALVKGKLFRFSPNATNRPIRKVSEIITILELQIFPSQRSKNDAGDAGRWERIRLSDIVAGNRTLRFLTRIGPLLVIYNCRDNEMALCMLKRSTVGKLFIDIEPIFHSKTNLILA